MTDAELIPAGPSEDPFNLEPNKPGFEDLGQSNGFRFWWAQDLMKLLGYETFSGFRASINKAMMVCTQLDIDLSENIVSFKHLVDGKETQDFKLSRFACYLVAMNGDVKKPAVAQAQAYFATFAQAIQTYVEQSEAVDRVQIRGEVSERERSLSGVAHSAGVVQYAFFQNAGYRGLYNMDLRKLRTVKGVPEKRSLLDFMGREELAANLFRITQTESKIRNEKIKGQSNLENAAEAVGREVRGAIKKIGGAMPETLAAGGDIKVVKKNLKITHRELKKLDGPSKKKK